MNRIPDFPEQDDVLRDAGIKPGAPIAIQPAKKQEQETPQPVFLTQDQIMREARGENL